MDSRASPSPLRSAAVAAAVLAVAATAAVAVLALVHERAAPQIEASRRAEQLRQLTALLGGAAYDNDPLADTVSVRDPELLGTDEPLTAHRVRLGGAPVAVLLNVVAPDGYAGAIRLLVAIDPQGRLLGVRVLEHHETPGLGDLLEERRSGWIHGFDGRALGDPPIERWAVRKDGGDFDQFTGATVTPRAVVRSVRNALVYFSRHRDELLAAPSRPPAP
jgi:electron transport complex protein RnfG